MIKFNVPGPGQLGQKQKGPKVWVEVLALVKKGNILCTRRILTGHVSRKLRRSNQESYGEAGNCKNIIFTVPQSLVYESQFYRLTFW